MAISDLISYAELISSSMKGLIGHPFLMKQSFIRITLFSEEAHLQR